MNDVNKDQKNNDEIEQLRTQVERLTQELKEATDPYTLGPRILDIVIEARGDKTPYVDSGYTVACDVTLILEWQGRRYHIPAFEL